ncbi:hypothetical protein FPZ24_09635 [Sphingomonas panacisoli]|uniref:Preprotein translocase subunit YajC n=1 Tax=Sphingomonas panacisoli TaxID=1813879 RepID=A0A5B8LIQ0_9SPHN|nr:hypothetical protein [Sphingomonas panacisoli]QDZ07719.1 hypothetical protein FPZ24_09635 [Sphingomonas panacisoli]
MIIRITGAVAIAALLAATPAVAQDRDGGKKRRVSVAPYIELGQVLTADVQSGDVLTYTSAAAGVDVGIDTQRVSVNLSARYEHQFTYDSRSSDSDIVSGFANAQLRLARGLSIEAGGIATRTRNDIRGFAPSFFGNDNRNVSSVYSAYVGPSFATGRGPIFVNGGYRFAYTKVTEPGPTGVAPGSPRLDYFDDSKLHMATLSTGFKSGTVLPFGVTLSGGWTREDQGQLGGRFEGLYGRGDVVLPLSGTFAVEGGVGYEKITSSARDPLLDAGGDPVLDRNGRFVTDPASPRRIAYRTDGIYWDAGVLWRPSPRTSLEARVGRRYGSWTYTGSLSYAPTPSVGVQIGVYDQVETFGSQLQRGLRGLPKEFTQTRDLLAQQFSGCTFGTTGGGASGACLNSVFQSVSEATYRSRGVDGTISLTRGGTQIGLGAGYANRKFYAPQTPGIVINGITDESYYAQLFYSTQLGPRTTLSGDVFANYYNSGLAPGILSIGATGSLSQSFGRLGTSLSIGAYTFSQDGQQDQTQAQATVGARYQF